MRKPLAARSSTSFAKNPCPSTTRYGAHRACWYSPTLAACIPGATSLWPSCLRPISSIGWMASRFKVQSTVIEATDMVWKVIAVFLAACALALPACADEALWSLLKSGGKVVLMRHAVTTPGAGDPEGMVLNDCSTQRNLTDEGRAHARRVGETVRARGVSVTQILSSPWCRCLETARLAFGS